MSSSPTEPPDELLSIDDIDAGILLVESKGRPDSKDLLEDQRLEAKRLENKLAKSRIKDARADRGLRKTYANRILRYLETYSVVVALFVIFDGFDVLGFSLPENVITALVGSTAIAAIGLVGFIAKGLFKPTTNL